MDKLKFIWYQNRYKMVHFTKEIMMLLRPSLAVMWFCLFNMHFSVQCTRCRWPEGIQSEKSSLAIMCCLPYQKVQFRYKEENEYEIMFMEKCATKGRLSFIWPKRGDILWIRNCDIVRQIEAPPEKRATKCCVYVLSDDPYPELT